MLFPLFVAPVAVTDATSVQTDTSALTPLDPTTGRPIPPRDESGQPLVPTDATGQPIILRDESGQPLPTPPDTAGTPTQPDSLLVNRGGGVEFDPAMAALRVRGEGTVYRLHVELVEGYNSNVVQTGLAPAVPHPALFTGLDVGLELLTATSPTDMQVIRFVVRGQQYVPLDGYHELDDGTVTASFARTFTLSPRTFVTSTVFGTLTSSNSALISDGPVLVPDPSELTRVYTEDLARIGFVHELGPRWRLVGGADVTVQATISEAPFQEPNGTLIYHSGLDDIVPGADLTLTHDLDPYNIGMLMARYEFTDVPFVANYTTESADRRRLIDDQLGPRSRRVGPRIHRSPTDDVVGRRNDRGPPRARSCPERGGEPDRGPPRHVCQVLLERDRRGRLLVRLPRSAARVRARRNREAHRAGDSLPSWELEQPRRPRQRHRR